MYGKVTCDLEWETVTLVVKRPVSLTPSLVTGTPHTDLIAQGTHAPSLEVTRRKREVYPSKVLKRIHNIGLLFVLSSMLVVSLGVRCKDGSASGAGHRLCDVPSEMLHS